MLIQVSFNCAIKTDVSFATHLQGASFVAAYLLIFAYIEDDLVFSLTWTKKHKCIWATMIHADREGVFQWAQVVYVLYFA